MAKNAASYFVCVWVQFFFLGAAVAALLLGCYCLHFEPFYSRQAREASTGYTLVAQLITDHRFVWVPHVRGAGSARGNSHIMPQ